MKLPPGDSTKNDVPPGGEHEYICGIPPSSTPSKGASIPKCRPSFAPYMLAGRCCWDPTSLAIGREERGGGEAGYTRVCGACIDNAVFWKNPPAYFLRNSQRRARSATWPHGYCMYQMYQGHICFFTFRDDVINSRLTFRPPTGRSGVAMCPPQVSQHLNGCCSRNEGCRHRIVNL